MRFCVSLAIATVLGCLLVGEVEASINYVTAGSAYSQSFDSLAASGTSNAWSNDTTLDGWHLYNSTSAAITTYAAGTGSIGTGSFYSFGSAAGDRALGGVASGGAYFGSPTSGAVAGWIAFAATNNTGSPLDSFTVGYNGEQWRNGGSSTPTTVAAAPQTMVLEYGFGSTFAAVSSWTAPSGNFDWASPVVSNTAAAVDGNAAGLVSGKGGTISNLNWSNGDTLWIRWIELNDINNDHGLAIDDFTFSANFTSDGVVPEPASMLVWGGIGLAGIGLAVYKKKAA